MAKKNGTSKTGSGRREFGPVPPGPPGYADPAEDWADPNTPEYGEWGGPALPPEWQPPAEASGQGNGFGGSGGYSGPEETPAALPYNPDTDPVYAAYIAQLDLSQQQRQAETARRKEYLMADQDRMIEETGRAGEQTREGISGNYESRGLFNSGGRLRDISRQQGNQNSRENQIRTNAQRGASDLEVELANNLAQAQLKRQSARLGIFS